MHSEPSEASDCLLRGVAKNIFKKKQSKIFLLISFRIPVNRPSLGRPDSLFLAGFFTFCGYVEVDEWRDSSSYPGCIPWRQLR
jgi:hypothetical protein